MATREGAHRVFVYGTLKRGFFNHHVLADAQRATWRGSGVARRELHLSIGGDHLIPYLQDGAAADPPAAGRCVRGEVYDVDDHMLARLDELEGVPTHYQRHQVQVDVTPPGAAVAAEEACYVYIKTELDRALLAQDPLEEYSLEAHAAYTPPPMRRLGWRDPLDAVRAAFASDPAGPPGPRPEGAGIYDADAFKRLLAMLAASSAMPVRVLEVGCGAAAPGVVRVLAAGLPAAEVVAVDACPEQVERARAALGETASARIVVHDAVELGTAFPLRHFAAVLCTQVLQYVPSDLEFHVLRTLAAFANLPGGGALLLDWPKERGAAVRRHAAILGLAVTAPADLGAFEGGLLLAEEQA